MKKIIYVAGVMLASMTLASTTAPGVSAVSSNPIRQGKKLNLTRGAGVYNRKGIKVGHLKKGKVYKVRAIKIINGNTYVKIAKNRFVKKEAFLPYSESTINVMNKIKKPSFVYDEKGEKIPGKFLRRGTKVHYLGHKEIEEKPFVKIGAGEYVKAMNVLTTLMN
ncbi:SLAP domain-containing protein [Lactobacillus kefiranofaciens]|uniref:SLAP domain-containing protein n=1 Tax=Lactobacillus kefiranofaciens TaxID=267818 RepID=UPI002468B836|nr:SLAP domain-containing protein [Lactobacillus kefiranofaciens]MDH5099644.1 SLAP domain-containing protein [Lactobacillus kefiranofaciens]